MAPPPITLEISGSGAVDRYPERGVLYLTIRTSGYDKSRVSGSVETTGSRIQKELNERLSPRDPSDPSGKTALPSAAVDKWNTGSMETSAHQEAVYDASNDEDTPKSSIGGASSLFGNVGNDAGNDIGNDNTNTSTNTGGFFSNVSNTNTNNNKGGKGGSLFGSSKRKQQPSRYVTRYHASIEMSVRFADFAALSEFTSWLAASVPHVVVHQVRWLLLPATERALRDAAIRDAYADALAKASAYGDVMRETAGGGAGGGGRPLHVTPLTVRDDSDSPSSGRARRRTIFDNDDWHRAGGFGGASGLFGNTVSDAARGASTAQQDADAAASRHLTYSPVDVTLRASCTCKFNIAPAGE